MLTVKVDLEEKPEKCTECPFFSNNDSNYVCLADKNHRDLQYKDPWRPFWCPLEKTREFSRYN